MVTETDGRNGYPLDSATDDSILHRDGDGGGPRLGGAGAADSAPKWVPASQKNFELHVNNFWLYTYEK